MLKSMVWPIDPPTPTDEPDPVCEFCGNADCEECPRCGGPECHPVECNHYHCEVCRNEARKI